MLLLQISLQLAAPAPSRPFYGGVLHGMVADKKLASLLQAGSFMHLLPPPVNADPAQPNGAVDFHFGVVIHPKQNLKPWLVRFGQLCEGGQLHLGGTTCRVTSHRCIDPDTLGMTPPSQACNQLRIDWLTPTLIATKQKIALGLHKQPPSLPSVVNSAIHRIAKLDPTRAASFGYDPVTWPNTIQALHGVTCVQDQSQFFSDSYQSRSSGSPAMRPLMGIIGHSVYSASSEPIAPMFLHILQWGQWVGVGEGVSQGRGCYQVQQGRNVAA